MALNRCPGQDRRFWKPGDIFDAQCPHCGEEIEFWKDDVRVSCTQCGKVAVNPRLNLACAQWCKWAEQCLEGLTLEDRLLAAAKDTFSVDDRRFNHAVRVLEYAKRLLEADPAEARVVISAAVLRGVDAAEAREILGRLGVDEETVDPVCDIVARGRAPRDGDPIEFDIVCDAEALAGWIEDGPPDLTSAVEGDINRTFRTAGGRRLAKAVFLRMAPGG